MEMLTKARWAEFVREVDSSGATGRALFDVLVGCSLDLVCDLSGMNALEDGDLAVLSLRMYVIARMEEDVPAEFPACFSPDYELVVQRVAALGNEWAELQEGVWRGDD